MRGLFVNDQSTDITKLRQLIGVRVRYLEDIWQVIEILEDGPTLVLESLQQRKVVQQNQYGEGHRRVPHRLSIPIYGDDRQSLHPDFLTLELL